MEVKKFHNQLRGYKIVVALLQAESEDICKGCIGLDGALTKAEKGLRKLKLDLQMLSGADDEKSRLHAQIGQLTKQLDGLPRVENPTCMKTAGLCKIGSDCFPLDGAVAMMKQITT